MSCNPLHIKQERWMDLEVEVIGIAKGSAITIMQKGFAIVVEPESIVALIEALDVARKQQRNDG